MLEDDPDGLGGEFGLMDNISKQHMDNFLALLRLALQAIGSQPSSSHFDRSGQHVTILTGTSPTIDLTIYDACYLELAPRLGLPLASLDRRLCQADSAAGAKPIVTA